MTAPAVFEPIFATFKVWAHFSPVLFVICFAILHLRAK